MQKALLLIWLMVYTLVSTGFAVSTHYCMNEKLSVTLAAEKKDRCGRCGMHKNKKNDCCRDEVKVVKLHHDAPTAFHFVPKFDQPIVIAPLPYFEADSNFIVRHIDAALHAKPPPFSPIYLTNRVFRI